MSDGLSVEVDAREAVAMFERLAELARGRSAFDGPRQSAAEQGASMISGIPSETGELAGSVQAGGRSNPGLIVAESDHARFVFGGTRYMDAQAPTVPAQAIADVLAAEVAAHLGLA